MVKINDFKTSTPKREGANHTWVWEVVVLVYNERTEIHEEHIVACFFDPWKAIQYGIDQYDGMCMVQAGLHHTANLKG